MIAIEDKLVVKKRIVALQREDLKRKYPKLWLAKYFHRNSHQECLSFGPRFRFLEEIYKELDVFTSMCSMKSVQSGLTELFTVSALEEAERGLRILYVLPNGSLRGNYVKDRLDIQLKLVPHYNKCYRESLGESESVGLKHYSTGTLNFVSSRAPAEFTMYQADTLYIDEVDRCDQKNIAMATDRMDASKYKFDRRIGNPSIEGWGISSVYNNSSQGVWMLKCTHCKTDQVPDFFANVVRQVKEATYEVVKGSQTEPIFVCAKCGKEIDPMIAGRWVHKYSDCRRRGYHVNQLFSANVTLASLVELFFKSVGNEVETQIFYNSKLGLPYSSEGSKLNYAILEEAAKQSVPYLLSLNNTSAIRTAKRVYVGIDVGKYYHVVARELLPSGMRKLVLCGKYSSTTELVNALKVLPSIKLICIDEMPELHQVEEMKKTLKKMFSCKFVMGNTLLDLRRGGADFKRERRVSIDRTFILDCVKADFYNRKMINPVNAKDLDGDATSEYGEYYSHLLASTRTYDDDAGRFVWREAGPDHYFLAESYCKFIEMVDDKILDYYKKAADDYKEGVDQQVKKSEDKEEKPLIPTTEDGKPDIEKLKVQNANTFLQNVFNRYTGRKQ